MTLISLLMLLATHPLFGAGCGSATAEYNLLMQIRGREITGICLMNLQPDSTVVGTVINEFGVKAFDFTRADGKTNVLNVIGPLDKWYIRKVLRKDFTFILSNIWQHKDVIWKKRKMTFSTDGDIIVENQRFKIRYTFTPVGGDLSSPTPIVHETNQ